MNILERFHRWISSKHTDPTLQWERAVCNHLTKLYNKDHPDSPWPSDDLCPPPITDKQTITELKNYFLGENYYFSMPISHEQVNFDIVFYIMSNNNGNQEYVQKLLNEYEEDMKQCQTP